MDLFQSYENSSTSAENCRFLIYGCSVETNDLYLITQFQKRAAPSYFTMSIQERRQAVRIYCFSGYDSPHPDAEVLRFLLREDKILQPMDLQMTPRDEYSLIHSAAIAFGRASRSFQTAISKSKVEEPPWKPLLRQIVSWAKRANVLSLVERVRHRYSICTPNLICDEEWTGTPLLSLFKGIFIDEYRGGVTGIGLVQKVFEEHKIVVQRALRQWLEVLAWCRVDLTCYGQDEANFFASNAFSFKFALSHRKHRLAQQDFLRKALPVRLCSLEIGNTPQDWHVDWIVDTECNRLAGEFWRIEEAESKEFLSMPGTWPG